MWRDTSLRSCQDVRALRQKHAQHALARTAVSLPHAVQARKIVRSRKAYSSLGRVVLLQRRAHRGIVGKSVVNSLLNRKLPYIGGGCGGLLRKSRYSKRAANNDGKRGQRRFTCDLHGP